LTATSAAGQLSDQLAAPLLEAARGAFTSGLHAVAVTAAVVLAAVAVLIVTTLRHLPPIGQTQTTQSEQAEQPDPAFPTSDHPDELPADTPA